MPALLKTFYEAMFCKGSLSEKRQGSTAPSTQSGSPYVASREEHTGKVQTSNLI